MYGYSLGYNIASLWSNVNLPVIDSDESDLVNNLDLESGYHFLMEDDSYIILEAA